MQRADGMHRLPLHVKRVRPAAFSAGNGRRFRFVRGLVVVEGLSSAFTEIQRFPNARCLLHPHSGVVVFTGTVDSSKDFCVGPDGVVRFVAQPTTFKTGVVHVHFPFQVARKL